jgi:hypothetical protein
MLKIFSIALVLQMHNFAGAPASIVESAQRELTRVYADIGVPLEWAGAEDRTDAGARRAMHIILVDREAGVLRRSRDTVLGATMWTDKGTPAVYVFYQRVEAEARRHAVSLALLLACTLAHELGHVLMPDRGHSAEGLMRARWNGDDFHNANQGQLRFVPEQVAVMRAAARQ